MGAIWLVKYIDPKKSDLEKRLEALESKNAELLSEVKAERRKRRDAEQAREEAAEEARAKAEEAAGKSGDVNALRQQLESKHAKALETERKAREAAEAQLNKLVIDGSIDAALDAAITLAGHRHLEPMLPQDLLVVTRTVLAAAIAVKDGNPRRGSQGDGHLQGPDRQIAFHAVAHGPTDHAPEVQV